MATTADFRNGLCFNYNGKIVKIIEFQHVKPGKGPAFVRTKLRNLENGKVITNTFTAGVKIETVRIETRNYQFLYKDDMGYNLMNSETYEQTAVNEELISAPKFLKDGMEVEVMVHAENEEVLGVELPQYVEFEITYTEPGVKGNTATNATKPAKIETGAEIRVPLFVNQGDIVKIDTRSGDYNERVKK
ncbi:MAG: elongation factor P [Flavobacteriales bacterium]|nr:elongation factor P [Flavobacteriales bacterium]|tara:strand:- start:9488 stop:10054 length:567 start_codon:yes stop_codon:yes gene_type:complete